MSEDNNPSAVPDILVSQVRIGLTALGTFLATNGYVTSEQGTAIAGAAMVIATALWSWYARWKSNQKLKDAIAAPVGKAAP